MMFDMNVRARNSKDKDRQHLLKRTYELGWSGIAWTTTISGKLNSSTRPPDEVSMEPFQLKHATGLRRLVCGDMQNYEIRQVSRINIAIDDALDAHSLSSGNEILGRFDIVSCSPGNVKVFNYLCKTADVDIISLDFTHRLQFSLNKKFIDLAVQRGIFFEIVYSPVLSSPQSRRETINGVKVLIQYLRGRNIIISSGTDILGQLRGPLDVVAIGQSINLTKECASKAISENCIMVLKHAFSRKLRYLPTEIVSSDRLCEKFPEAMKVLCPGLTSKDHARFFGRAGTPTGGADIEMYLIRHTQPTNLTLGHVTGEVATSTHSGTSRVKRKATAIEGGDGDDDDDDDDDDLGDIESDSEEAGDDVDGRVDAVRREAASADCQQPSVETVVGRGDGTNVVHGGDNGEFDDDGDVSDVDDVDSDGDSEDRANQSDGSEGGFIGFAFTSASGSKDVDSEDEHSDDLDNDDNDNDGGMSASDDEGHQSVSISSSRAHAGKLPVRTVSSSTGVCGGSDSIISVNVRSDNDRTSKLKSQQNKPIHKHKGNSATVHKATTTAQKTGSKLSLANKSPQQQRPSISALMGAALKQKSVQSPAASRSPGSALKSGAFGSSTSSLNSLKKSKGGMGQLSR